jgi:tRNA threonylcarbamoyladenosine biosynthesis protein TsaE
MNYNANSEKELPIIADKLLQEFGEHKVVLLYGEMGTGKTTLIKFICKHLGVVDATSSPTFSIVNEYLTNENKVVYHFDFYRIVKESEVLDLGYEDYFYSGNYCFIEWPEKIPNLIPENTIGVNIKLDKENNRLISVVR